MKINTRHLILGSACLVIVLLTAISLLCPTQLPRGAQSNQYPANAPAPVSTFTPAGLSLIHMFDDNTGWAVGETSSFQNDTLLFTPRLFHTADRGQPWAVDGNPSAVWLALFEVTPAVPPSPEHAAYCFLNANSAWLALNDGDRSIAVYHTANGGRTWGRGELTSKQDNGVPIPRDICFVDARHGWILVGYGVAMGSEWDEIYHTVDGGRDWTLAATTGDWQQRKPGAFPLEGVKNGLCFKDDQNGFLTGDGRGDISWFYATHDAGSTWTFQPVPVCNNKGVGVETQTPVFVNANDGILPVTLHNDDGSQDAFARGPGSPWQSIAFPTKSIHPMIFFRTADGGQTWQATTPVSPASDNYLSWSIADMEHIVATDGDTIYQTDDGARIWATMAPDRTLQGLLRHGERITALDFVTGATGWALLSSPDNQATQLVGTTDSGQSWRLVHLMERPER